MSANVTALSIQWRTDLLMGTHSLTTTSNPMKASLHLVNSSIGGLTLTYSSVSGTEVSGSGYSAGGISVTNGTAPTNNGSNNVAYWTPSAALAYGTVTLSSAFDTVLFYYTSDSHVIGSWNFGSTTITSGTFTLNMPTNAYNTGLIQLG